MCTLIFLICFTLATCPHPIELSSQPKLPPGGDRVPVVSRGRPSVSSSKNDQRPVIDLNYPPAMSPPPVQSAPHVESDPLVHSTPIIESTPLAEFLPRIRSRSPARPSSSSSSITSGIRLPSPDGYGCGLEQLEFIRLISNANPLLIFELRKYNFPADKLLQVKTESQRYVPVSCQEQIVLSKYSGDVFAIVKSENELGGIYERTNRGMRRVKINVYDTNVTPLYKEDVDAIPVGFRRAIIANYAVYNIKDDPLPEILLLRSGGK